jgi:hypothetical protein
MKFYIYLTTILLFTACSLSSEDTLTLPYKSDFSTSKGWDLGSDAKIENRALKLSHSGMSWRTSDRAISSFTLPVKAGKTYTISLKSKSSSLPLPSVEISGSYYGDDGFISNSLGSIITNSKPNTWEESTVYIEIPNNQAINKFKIRIIDFPKKGVNGDIFIKDVQFKKGFYTTEKKPIKKSFDGSVTRVDKLGNIEIFKNGRYEPFFPIGIYTDHKRAGWSIYKKQGFNIAMWTDGAGAIKKAKNAGLYSSMQLIQYIIHVDSDWIPQNHNKKIAHLKSTLQKIKNQGLTNDLLFYYIDNEFYHTKREFTEIIDIVLDQDIDKNGKRMHPIYMLSGTYALARKYNKWVDFTGTYAAEDMYETDRTKAFVTLNETQNQTQPAVIAQINRGVDKNFRAILFGAIAKGARGMAFWRDGGTAGDIKNQPWWSELPKISQEIKQMMPLIRADHHTSWSVKSDNNNLIFGTRTVNNIGYMIIANPTRSKKTVTFTLKNLPYKANLVKDYFTKKSITKVQNNNFSITMPPQSSKVIKLTR